MKTKCPHCGQHYEVEDCAVGTTVTCENCWKDFTVSDAAAAPPPPAAAKPASEPTISRCPFCGGDITPEAKKCRHCGEWIRKDNKTKITALMVIGVVLLIAAAVALAIRDYKNMKKTELEGAREGIQILGEQAKQTAELHREIQEYEARLLRLRSQTNLTSIERQEEAYLVKKLRERYAQLGIEYKDVIGK